MAYRNTEQRIRRGNVGTSIAQKELAEKIGALISMIQMSKRRKRERSADILQVAREMASTDWHILADPPEAVRGYMIFELGLTEILGPAWRC